MSKCCNDSECTTQESGICPVCSKKGKSVDKITPEHLLFEEQSYQLRDVNYYFCPTSTCDVVYFSQDSEHYFTKSDVKTRIGLKETDGPIPICYCFDFTRDKIWEEIRQTGQSTVSNYITEKIQTGDCACEVKNPSGCCCLGEVNTTVKKGLRVYRTSVIIED